MKPIADFNVLKEWDFLNRLLPQGAWTRCTRCQRQQRGLAGAEVKAELGSELGGTNETCVERRPLASLAVHSCIQCQATKPRAEFWEVDWPHRHRGSGFPDGSSYCLPRPRPLHRTCHANCEKQTSLFFPVHPFRPRRLEASSLDASSLNELS